MERKSIEKKVVKRLLSHSYPSKLLNGLLCLNEQIERASYTNEELLQLASFLKGTSLEISELKKLRANIKKELADRINALAESDIGTLYDIAILIFALSKLTFSPKREKELLKTNPKINFCCDYIMMLPYLDTDYQQKKMLQHLKEI